MTTQPAQTPARRWPRTPPTLQNGDNLSLAEFKYLYANSPQIRRAELLEGVVHVPSPVYVPHASAQGDINGLLYTYQSQTPGTIYLGEQSIELDSDNYVQPDAILFVEGSVTIADGLLIGAPTLVVEVAVSTRAHDLGVKKHIYRRNRVQEYLVLAAFEQEIYWFQYEGGEFQPLLADAAGIYRSRAFPGLWLNAPAFWRRETRAVLATLQQGLATAEHAGFVAGLAR